MSIDAPRLDSGQHEPLPVQDPNIPQARASDPAVSAWVTANAGSGKTKVLIDRVARLLLGSGAPGGAPADPSRILCLTYTRAAAANMLNKLFQALGGWALMDDPALMEALGALQEEGKRIVREDELPAARRLFAQALETPGGLKIQTIHAFCESLLRRFPLEAGVSPHFTLMDEPGSAALIREARDRAITRALAGDDAALEAATGRVIDSVQEHGVDGLMKEILKHREAFEPPVEETKIALCDALDVAPEDSEEGALAAFDAAAPAAAVLRLAQDFLVGGKTEAKAAPALITAFEQGDAAERLSALRAALLTGKGEPRAPRGFPTKAVKDANPGAADLIADLQERLAFLDNRLRAIKARDDSLALAFFAKAALAEIRALKIARDALDFDDLIRLAGDLLTRSEARDWVRYKLDGGVDHILVDEAQDTSKTQWKVVGAIAEEFFAGEGARPAHRTLFVVGDEKQSIYSFQGAAPDELDRMRQRFAELTQGVDEELRQPRLLHSFRSAPAVLNAVDLVFAQDAVAQGLTAAADAIAHIAQRRDAPGRVELWPPATPFAKAEDAPWWTPVDAAPPQAPHLRLADAIADRIGAMLKGERLPARDRAIRPGDILILVRRRDKFADAMIRALKARGLPVAGQDRMALTEPLAVRDLLALARFALMPDDDLTLACVLRSPLLGFSEDALFDLAHHRKGRLWRNLVRRREEREDFTAAHALLADMLGQADFLRPYEFFQRALTRWNGRARILGRLGREAEDPVEELLNQALAFEENETPTLQAFVERLDGADFQVKRELEQGGDEIRLMTAHGAKGLEAKIVFLPDTWALPPDRGETVLEVAGAPVWSPRRAGDPAPVKQLRDESRARERAEYRRLLYVAMTRAEDWLVLCGWHGEKPPKEGVWHQLAAPVLRERAEAIETPLLDEAGAPLMGRAVVSDGPGIPREKETDEQLDLPLDPPRMALTPAPRETAPPPPVSPSRLAEHEPYEPVGPPAESEDAPEPPVSSAERGTLIHDLLEALAPLAPDARHTEGARMLAARGGAEEALTRALDILENPDFAWMFGPDSIAEAALAGAVAGLGGAAVSGRLDRLVVRTGRVDVIDFKTGRRPEATPEPYLLQLAVYTSALEEMFPGFDVRAHLLWLDARRLDTLEPAALTAALTRARAVVDRARPAP